MQGKAVILLVSCVAILLCVAAVKLRDEDQTHFLRDGMDAESRPSFAAAAAEMDACPPEPIVDGQSKSKWPELVGKTAQDAQAVLEQQAPGFMIQVLGADQMATMEWRCNRIRIWLDSSNKVARPPMIG